uniref:Uncharacterized protein n=1 Tax=Pseudomonas phage Cygsa01 TaxID=3138529 RepID=A0AAU6W3J6_9VIRU
MDQTLFLFLALCVGMLGFIALGSWRFLLIIVRHVGRAFRGRK